MIKFWKNDYIHHLRSAATVSTLPLFLEPQKYFKYSFMIGSFITLRQTQEVNGQLIGCFSICAAWTRKEWRKKNVSNDRNAFVSDREEKLHFVKPWTQSAWCSALYMFFLTLKPFFFFLAKQKSDTKDKTWETYWSNSDGILLSTASNRTSLCGTYWANQYQHIPMDSTTEFMAFSADLHQYIKETWRG